MEREKEDETRGWKTERVVLGRQRKEGIGTNGRRGRWGERIGAGREMEEIHAWDWDWETTTHLTANGGCQTQRW